MADRSHTEDDARHHTENIAKMMKDLVDHPHEDIGKVEHPQARALFEVSAQVIQGLQRSFEHYEMGSEKACKK